jgi:IS30 family transposase
MGQLTVEQRYTIQVLKKQGFAQKMIAEQIGKNASVVCRELLNFVTIILLMNKQ